jgi:hypothetical protein
VVQVRRDWGERFDIMKYVGVHGAEWDIIMAPYNQMDGRPLLEGIQATECLVSASVCVFLPGRSGDEK